MNNYFTFESSQTCVNLIDNPSVFALFASYRPYRNNTKTCRPQPESRRNPSFRVDLAPPPRQAVAKLQKAAEAKVEEVASDLPKIQKFHP